MCPNLGENNLLSPPDLVYFCCLLCVQVATTRGIPLPIKMKKIGRILHGKPSHGSKHSSDEFAAMSPSPGSPPLSGGSGGPPSGSASYSPVVPAMGPDRLWYTSTTPTGFLAPADAAGLAPFPGGGGPPPSAQGYDSCGDFSEPVPDGGGRMYLTSSGLMRQAQAEADEEAQFQRFQVYNDSPVVAPISSSSSPPPSGSDSQQQPVPPQCTLTDSALARQLAEEEDWDGDSDMAMARKLSLQDIDHAITTSVTPKPHIHRHNRTGASEEHFKFGFPP